MIYPSHAEDEQKQKEHEREEAQRQGEVAKRMWDKTPLPHEGVKREDMTDEQRVERGAAVRSPPVIYLLDRLTGCRSWWRVLWRVV